MNSRSESERNIRTRQKGTGNETRTILYRCQRESASKNISRYSNIVKVSTNKFVDNRVRSATESLAKEVSERHLTAPFL